MKTKVKRRLASILCADVKSYSRLIERDETGTLETLRSSRNAMAALVDRHDGRIVNTWGDAVIVEFPSVVDAVQCAIEIQRELAARNHERPGDRQMWFRVGISLGDVMVENGDIYGEGINIAARLQELAEPGGILLSSAVYEQVRNKIPTSFAYLGAQRVKNVSHPVQSYRLALEGPAPALDEPVENLASGPAAHRLRTLSCQWAGLPRSVKVAASFIVFFFALNAFSGFRDIWFQWPSSVLLLFIVLYLTLRKRRAHP